MYLLMYDVRIQKKTDSQTLGLKGIAFNITNKFSLFYLP